MCSSDLVGGFGAGVALGMLAGRDSDAEEEPQRRERRSPSRHRAGGMTSRLVDLFTAPMIMNTIAQPVQSEMRSLVQELVSGFLGTAERPERSQWRADPPHERREASGGVSGHEAGARTDGRTPAGDAHSKETASGLSGRERRP